MGQVAKDFDHTEIAVREWVKQAERDAGTRQDGGLTSSERAELRRWADTVLRQHYGGYELRGCWPSHIHGIWELSTLAAVWHHAYDGERPDLARALEFYDRWLPDTMRRINAITRTCVPECATRRRPW